MEQVLLYTSQIIIGRAPDHDAQYVVTPEDTT